ncbi:MAG: hypothetical protein PW789_07325 [Edaphobacter sp.]|uniref:hypothetical protein n=1 Tax=Edaphobacter sp. TaxID=1934404 RepID=UPI0023A0FAF0|nr:hypothetical protein [Edaphobacter sp.]MDE1176405.1 hypothetical protein [Edaphobacter sp.]
MALSSCGTSFAEQDDPVSSLAVTSLRDLPDAPSALLAQQSTSSPSSSSGQVSQPPPQGESPTASAKAPPQSAPPQQTKRIMGIMPNFSAVSADTKLPPQTVKEKFVIAAKNSFDYSSFIIAGIQSGISMASSSYPEFGHGVGGYGQYYYHTLLDTADANFMVAGLWPVLFHQDNRFYTLGHGSFKRRAFYAATRVLVTRNDSGRNGFNASEIIGAGSAQGIATLYYPSEYRTWTKVGQKWLTAVIIDSANYAFKEFWPDINNKLSKLKKNKQ